MGFKKVFSNKKNITSSYKSRHTGTQNTTGNQGFSSYQSPSLYGDCSNHWIYGRHPVLMAINNPKRKIYKIIISASNQKEIERHLSEKKIILNKNLIEIKDNGFISSLLSESSLHQGFALKTSPIAFAEEKNFIIKLANFDKKKLPPILILDQLTDPHNVGAIIRSAVAFGVENIVVTRNFPKDSAIICKSSSGMIELANLIIAGNLNNFLNSLKDCGYWCIGLDGKATVSINEIQSYPAIALIVGSEGDGIRNLVKKNCDLLVKILINPAVESLNASNATAISLYELFGRKS